MIVVCLAGCILFAGFVSPAAAAPWRPDKRAALEYLSQRSGSVSFAAVNESGTMWGHHRHRTVEAVSVFKAMLLATYLRMSSVRGRRLHDTDRDLLGPMIKWSDNTAASRIRDVVGHARIRRLARDAGMRRFRVVRPWGLSQITARDQARFFFRFERYVPNRHEDYARYLLAHIVPGQRWGMADFADDRMPAWKMFFKGGWGSGTGRWSHQVAFFEKNGRRIALAILTEHSPSHAYANRTMRGVARRLLRTR
ncbi:MAG: class A beta-lactamase-related serine hydrolase [Actinomycetota bacterium]|nr:class A beta-lactamase-related serine hydrolase [Actinomycetota bacterium]